MVRCGQPAFFMWLCKLHTIEDHVLCYATAVRSTNLLKSRRRLHVLQLYSVGDSFQRIHRLTYVSDSACHPQHIAKDCYGQAHCLVHLLTTTLAWYSTTRGLRSFRACTTTRMQLAGRNVPCKQWLCKRPPTAPNMYRGRNLLLYDARCKGYRYAVGTR